MAVMKFQYKMIIAIDRIENQNWQCFWPDLPPQKSELTIQLH